MDMLLIEKARKTLTFIFFHHYRKLFKNDKKSKFTRQDVIHDCMVDLDVDKICQYFRGVARKYSIWLEKVSPALGILVYSGQVAFSNWIREGSLFINGDSGQKIEEKEREAQKDTIFWVQEPI